MPKLNRHTRTDISVAHPADASSIACAPRATDPDAHARSLQSRCVKRCVFSRTSASSSPVRNNSTGGSNRSRYFRSDSSQKRNPGTTAASVRKAIRARPEVVDAGNAEKVHEHSFFERRCCGRTECPPCRPRQDLQNRARGFILIDRPIPRQAAVTIYQRIHARIGDRPHEKMQRMAVERVRERRKLPGAHVPGQKQHAFSAALPGVEILGAIDHHDLFDVLRACISETAKTRQPSSRSGGSFRG